MMAMTLPVQVRPIPEQARLASMRDAMVDVRVRLTHPLALAL
jgi:hypothetical protein